MIFESRLNYMSLEEMANDSKSLFKITGLSYLPNRYEWGGQRTVKTKHYHIKQSKDIMVVILALIEFNKKHNLKTFKNT